MEKGLPEQNVFLEIEALEAILNNRSPNKIKKIKKRVTDLYDIYCELRAKERKNYTEHWQVSGLILNNKTDESKAIQRFFIQNLKINPHSLLDNREIVKLSLENKIDRIVHIKYNSKPKDEVGDNDTEGGSSDEAIVFSSEKKCLMM